MSLHKDSRFESEIRAPLAARGLRWDLPGPHLTENQKAGKFAA